MNNAIQVTIDSAVEIEPVPRQVRIVRKGPLCIAVPVEEGPALSGTTVEQVRRRHLERMRGRATSGMSTEEIMALTRGED
jgi:hypothetical protein